MEWTKSIRRNCSKRKGLREVERSKERMKSADEGTKQSKELGNNGKNRNKETNLYWNRRNRLIERTGSINRLFK